MSLTIEVINPYEKDGTDAIIFCPSCGNPFLVSTFLHCKRAKACPKCKGSCATFTKEDEK